MEKRTTSLVNELAKRVPRKKAGHTYSKKKRLRLLALCKGAERALYSSYHLLKRLEEEAKGGMQKENKG